MKTYAEMERSFSLWRIFLLIFCWFASVCAITSTVVAHSGRILRWITMGEEGLRKRGKLSIRFRKESVAGMRVMCSLIRRDGWGDAVRRVCFTTDWEPFQPDLIWKIAAILLLKNRDVYRLKDWETNCWDDQKICQYIRERKTDWFSRCVSCW